MTRTEAILKRLRVVVYRVRGDRAWIQCSFHEGESASACFIRVSGRRAGQSHCFACKWGGGLVSFVMRKLDVDAEEARSFIRDASRGVEPPRASAGFREREAKVGRRRYALPPGCVLEPFDAWVSPARQYLEGRGFGRAEADAFGLGYAVDGTLAFRIVLPWRGANGVPMGFSARTFVDEEPRYLTPDEDRGADWGTMFGEHLWPAPDAEGKRPVVAVTEGAINGLAIWQVGGLPIAALGGSELHPGQAAKLATFRLIVVATDADEAGNKIAAKLRSGLSRYADLARAELPPGKDFADLRPEERKKVLRSAGIAL